MHAEMDVSAETEVTVCVSMHDCIYWADSLTLFSQRWAPSKLEHRMSFPWQYPLLLVTAAVIAVEAGVPYAQVDYISAGK